MPILIEWRNDEKNVIITTIEWPWTWDELSSAWKTGVEMMESVSHDVHMIAVLKSTRFPVGNILSNLTGVTKHVPENIGLAIAVSENRFQQAINTIFFKLSPRLSHKGHVVSNLETAYRLIAKEEAKHDMMSVNTSDRFA
jgi:hypothetical protein